MTCNILRNINIPINIKVVKDKNRLLVSYVIDDNIKMSNEIIERPFMKNNRGN